MHWGSGAVCTELENTAAMQRPLLVERRPLGFIRHVDPHSQYQFSTTHSVVPSARLVCMAGGGLPWACSSSLLSSSECGWLLPLVTFLALLLDRTPAPERSITEGMTARETNSRTTLRTAQNDLNYQKINRFEYEVSEWYDDFIHVKLDSEKEDQVKGQEIVI